MFDTIKKLLMLYKLYKQLKENENMKAIIDFLIGKKTYIICIAIGIVYTLQLLGIIPVDTAEKIIAYLAALGGITLAAKINRIGKPA